MKDIQGSCARVSRGSVWQQLLCSSLWEAAEALGPSLQPLQPFQQHWIHSQPWHCQWCLLKPGQGCWPLHLLKESFVTISSMRPSRKKAVKQQNSGDKCCWEGYSLSIPARDFLKGVLFLSSFLLPEKTIWERISQAVLRCWTRQGGRRELQQAVCAWVQSKAAESRSKCTLISTKSNNFYNALRCRNITLARDSEKLPSFSCTMVALVSKLWEVKTNLNLFCTLFNLLRTLTHYKLQESIGQAGHF